MRNKAARRRWAWAGVIRSSRKKRWISAMMASRLASSDAIRCTRLGACTAAPRANVVHD